MSTSPAPGLGERRPIAIKTKLTTLNPRWILGTPSATPEGAEPAGEHGHMEGRYGMGISFDCPVSGWRCPLHKMHRLKIFFANPVDGLGPERDVPLWLRTGGSFKALTVSPARHTCPECWRGFITNGEII